MKKLFLLFMICVSTFVNAQEKETDNFKKTDEVLSEVVKKALLVAEKTGNFVIEQSPLILQEFYNWHIYSSIFMALIFVFVFFVFQKISKSFGLTDLSKIDDRRKENYFLKPDGKYYFSDWSSGNSEMFAFAKVTNAISYFSFIGVFVWIYDLFFILVAPKLYLIEYFIK